MGSSNHNLLPHSNNRVSPPTPMRFLHIQQLVSVFLLALLVPR